ncbi:MAG TPA: dihydroorotate dehydrogenase [Negativicutes bacterium]|nr:dihydroorotate dehydrogenase [Negativicutes bacterium]
MTTKPDLAVKIAGLHLKNPVMTASGTFGFGKEYAPFVDLNQLGAIVVKGTTLNPRLGNAGRRLVETPAGMLNSIGLENPGVEHFIAHELPNLKKFAVPVIVNISGHSIDEYRELAAILDIDGVAAVEVNISCPNVREGGLVFGTDCASAGSVVRAVRRATGKTVIAKLSPNVTDIVSIAKAVADAGADALSLINTLLGMAIDIRTRRPKLGNIVGGLSGPAVKPVALRLVWQVAKAVPLPIIGMGGIMTGEDAVEFLLAGATAVAVGTANFVNPRATLEVAEGIGQYLCENNLSSVQEIIGALN